MSRRSRSNGCPGRKIWLHDVQTLDRGDATLAGTVSDSDRAKIFADSLCDGEPAVPVVLRVEDVAISHALPEMGEGEPLLV